jgi:hypothetical protein
VNKWRLWREYATGNHCKQLLHQFENGMYVSLKNINLPRGTICAWYIEDELVGSSYFLDGVVFLGLIAINLFLLFYKLIVGAYRFV